MSKYRMYSNSDSNKETIHMIEALDANDARYVFSKIKELDLTSFDSLYSVELYERK